MGRLKRSSSVLVEARKRADALATIDPKLDLGSSITLSAYQKQIADAQSVLEEYNSKLSETDALLDDLTAQETSLEDLNERMLAGVGVKFGKDSIEYGKAGGVRKSERKRRSSNGNGKANGNGQPKP